MKKNTIISILLVVIWVAIPAVVSYRFEVMETKMELLELKLADQQELQNQEETSKKHSTAVKCISKDAQKIREKMLRDTEEWMENEGDL